MNISENGLALVKHFEGCKLSAYVCPAGVLTIGYGSTGPHVRAGQTITQAQADALLAKDMERFEAGVMKLVKVALDQDEFDALCSFAFNLGLGALSGSTLLKKLNLKDCAGAAAEFRRWDKAGSKILPGLTRRRAAETALFTSHDWRAVVA